MKSPNLARETDTKVNKNIHTNAGETGRVGPVRLAQLLTLLVLISLSQLIRMWRDYKLPLSGDTAQQSEEQVNQQNDSNTLRQITFANYGWFHRDPKRAIQAPRCLAMKDFSRVVVAHDRYNASAWYDLDQQPDPNRPIIAFFDIDTCRLLHWPKFGGDLTINFDLEGVRTSPKSWNKKVYQGHVRTVGLVQVVVGSSQEFLTFLLVVLWP